MTPALQSACTTATHDTIRSDDEQWSALPYVGTQRFENEPSLEMRNCTVCFSTLCREVVS